MSELDSTVFIKKAWGSESVIANNNLYCLKKLLLLPGWQCSLHMHVIKDETFYIESGYLWMELDQEKFPMRTGDSVRIRPGTNHRFSNTGTVPCKIIEVSTFHSDNDVIRSEPSRKL